MGEIGGKGKYVGGWIILRCILKRQDRRRVVTAFVKLRLEISGEML
jgi:hypothetical protein